jgi:hypothetical protein
LDQAFRIRRGWPHGIRVLAIEHWISWARITFALICAYYFLQCDKAPYRYRGFPDETSTSEFAHNNFS